MTFQKDVCMNYQNRTENYIAKFPIEWRPWARAAGRAGCGSWAENRHCFHMFISFLPHILNCQMCNYLRAHEAGLVVRDVASLPRRGQRRLRLRRTKMQPCSHLLSINQLGSVRFMNQGIYSNSRWRRNSNWIHDSVHLVCVGSDRQTEDPHQL